MNKKDMDEKDMMEELLKAYHNNELEEVEPEGEAVPSEAFQERMKKMINSPDKWDKYKKRDRKRDKRKTQAARVQRVLALATLFFMLVLVVVKTIAPSKIAASIPEFFLRYGDSNENIEVLVNLDALNEEDAAQGIPEIEVGYVPEGFELVEKTTSLQGNLFTYRAISDSNTMFYITEMLYVDKNALLMNGEETTRIYVDAKEIVKTKHVDKENAYFYMWKEKGCLLELYTCNMSEEEAEKIIRSISVTDVHIEE